MSVAFFGTGKFGLESFERLIKEKINVNLVFTGRPQKSRRGQKLCKTPVHELAERLGLVEGEGIFAVDALDVEMVANLFAKNEVRMGIVISYGLIIRKEILDLLPCGFINAHPSLLPRWRGAAPIERAIESGDDLTGVDIICMTPRLDAGNVISRSTCPILASDSAISMYAKLSSISASRIVSVVGQVLASGSAGNSLPQEGVVTYAKKIQKQELLIDSKLLSSLTSNRILDRIRAFDNCGCCYIVFRNKRVKILDAELGEVANSSISMQCLDLRYVNPLLVVPEGRGSMDIASFENGICSRQPK